MAQLVAEANREAALAQAPLRAEIARQQAEERQRLANQNRGGQASAQATASFLAGLGPQVSNIYGEAANRQSAFAQGFSHGQQIAQNQASGDTNAFLENIVGAPAGQQQTPGAGAADAVYDMGGYEPASQLNREGAAFGSAFSAYPVAALGNAQQASVRNTAESNQRQKSLGQQLREIAAQQGQVGTTNLLRLKEAEQEKRRYYSEWKAKTAQQEAENRQAAQALWVQMQYLGLANNKQRLAIASTFGYDPVTGQATESSRHNQANEAAARARATATAKNKAAAAKAKTGKARATAVKNRTSAWVSLDKAAVSAGKSGLGKPVENPDFGSGKLQANAPDKRYLTPNGQGTNDPKKAARKGRVNGDTILTQVYQGYGSALEQRFGVPQAKILARIRRKLRALGYKV